MLARTEGKSFFQILNCVHAAVRYLNGLQEQQTTVAKECD